MSEHDLDVPRPEAEMEKRRQMEERVRPHSTYESFEKETGINFMGDELAFTLSSYKPTIVRSVLKHEYAVIQWIIRQSEYHEMERLDADDHLCLRESELDALREYDRVLTISWMGRDVLVEMLPDESGQEYVEVGDDE